MKKLALACSTLAVLVILAVLLLPSPATSEATVAALDLSAPVVAHTTPQCFALMGTSCSTTATQKCEYGPCEFGVCFCTNGTWDCHL